jgi:biofilm PGA synthesis N-glycosyltransferase PgaC
MTFLFWFFLSLIVYCFFGYPLLLILAEKLLRRPIAKSAIVPTVSILISAWNEEDVIGNKIENLLQLDYPVERVEILIGSDGSNDRTNEIVRSFHDPRIRLIERTERRGKTSTVNELVAAAKNEIVFFNDARQDLASDTLRKLVTNFADCTIGCVSGELLFHHKEGATAKGINLYWEYEKFMRNREASIHSMLGATGAIYAIRRELFCPVPSDIVLDDMYIPFKIIEKGFRAAFEPEARAFDHVADNPKEEYRRKARTLYGNFQIFSHFPNFFNPLTSPVAIQFFSHKLLRVVVPFLMAAVLIINLFLLYQAAFRWIMLVQIFFYMMAAAGAWSREHRTGILHSVSKVCYIPYVFCLLNFSVFIGFWRFINARQEITWQKARERR